MSRSDCSSKYYKLLYLSRQFLLYSLLTTQLTLVCMYFIALKISKHFLSRPRQTQCKEALSVLVKGKNWFINVAKAQISELLLISVPNILIRAKIPSYAAIARIMNSLSGNHINKKKTLNKWMCSKVTNLIQRDSATNLKEVGY